MARKVWKTSAGLRFNCDAKALAVVGPSICNQP